MRRVLHFYSAVIIRTAISSSDLSFPNDVFHADTLHFSVRIQFCAVCNVWGLFRFHAVWYMTNGRKVNVPKCPVKYVVDVSKSEFVNIFQKC